MYHFFIKREDIAGSEILVKKPEDVNHIKNVLRMHPGEQISFSCEETGKDYICRLTVLNNDEIRAVIEDIEQASGELPVHLVLFQGLPKSDKMDLIIQKAVELGVYEIVPVAMKRCVVRLDEKKAAKKLARWNEIARSAAKQSKRSHIPKIKDIMSFEQAVSHAESLDMFLLPYEDAKGLSHSRKIMETVKGKNSAGIFIGPEGGFEDKEIDRAIQAGAFPITLGHRILRTETAGMTVLSILMFMLDED